MRLITGDGKDKKDTELPTLKEMKFHFLKKNGAKDTWTIKSDEAMHEGDFIGHVADTLNMNLFIYVDGGKLIRSEDIVSVVFDEKEG